MCNLAKILKIGLSGNENDEVRRQQLEMRAHLQIETNKSIVMEKV